MARRIRPTAVIRLNTSILTDAQKQAVLERIAVTAIGLIAARTEKGVGLVGRFKAYSARYAKLRRDAGRRVDPPNLTLSGAMLASLQPVKVTSDVAYIGFVGSAPAARLSAKGRSVKRANGKRTTRTVTKSADRTTSNALKAIANHDRRPFFGLTPEEQAHVAREAGRLVSQLLRETSRS